MNKLLQRQLQKYLGQSEQLPESFSKLLNVISESYDHYEKDRKMMERSIDLSSKEMIELNSQAKKSGKAELEKAHNQLKTLFENIDEVLYSVDMVSFKILQISAACKKVTGYACEEFLADGDLWKKIVYPEDKDISKQQVQLLYQGKQVLNQYRIIHKNKSIRWIENKIIPTLDETGWLIRIDAVTNDITDRKIAEKKLEESVSILETTIESTADGILVLNFEGKIVLFNKKFTELWRIPLEILETKDNEKAIAYVSDQMENPGEFVSKIKELQAQQNEISFGIRKFKDGRIFERYSQPRLINGNCVGRVISFRDITEQKKTEKALYENEKRLRQIIDLVPHFIFAKDANGKFTLANEAVAGAYGCSVEDLIGKGDSDFNSNKEEVEHFIREDLEVINSGTAKYNIEETITDATGNVRILSTTKIPYTASGVDIPGLLGVSVDISERKIAEDAIKESEEKYKALVENAPEALVVMDVEKGKFIGVSESALKLFKMSKEDLLKIGPLEVSPEYQPDGRLSSESAIEHIQNAVAGNKPVFEWTHCDAFGNCIPCEVCLVRMPSEKNVIIRGSMIDISERKKAEAALKKNEGQLSIAAQIAKLGYWEFDVIKGLFTFNDQFYAIFKTTAEQLGGYTMIPERYAGLFVHPDDAPLVGKEVADAINSPDPHYNRQIEHRIIYANGETGHMAVRFFIVKDEQGRTIKTFGANQDITDRKKGEETLRISEANLELKNKELELKNKELEQFAYVASHDLQEPLRTTSSFAELLQRQYKGKLDEKADKYLTFINQSSDRMKVLIKDLLDYSRIGRKKELAQVDCNIIINEVLADLDVAIKETQAEIKFCSLPVFNGYPTEIKQLFQNLTLNSIKFRKRDTPLRLKISLQPKGHFWQFAFSDNGIGIAKEHHERIFIIFQRLHTRNEYDGSGIGLSHCKKIVELHKGKIWLESKLGVGTTFYFTIPQKLMTNETDLEII